MPYANMGFSNDEFGETKPRSKRRFDPKTKRKDNLRGETEYNGRSRRADLDDDDFDPDFEISLEDDDFDDDEDDDFDLDDDLDFDDEDDDL